MFKSIYLGDTMYFETFDKVKKYYNQNGAKDIDELNEMLEKEYHGMVSPVISEF